MWLERLVLVFTLAVDDVVLLVVGKENKVAYLRKAESKVRSLKVDVLFPIY